MEHAEIPAPPSVVDGSPHTLDPRYVDLQRQVGWITTAVVSGVSWIGLAMFAVGSDDPPVVKIGLMVAVLGALAALAWWLQRWPALEYRYASYRVDADGLEIRRGVWFRAVTNVPRSRVQHTDVSQGPLERRLGLATLVVHTAGSDEAEVQLPGLANSDALAIRDHLLPRDATDAV